MEPGTNLKANSMANLTGSTPNSPSATRGRATPNGSIKSSEAERESFNQGMKNLENAAPRASREREKKQK
jgi:hypothetical protein